MLTARLFGRQALCGRCGSGPLAIWVEDGPPPRAILAGASYGQGLRVWLEGRIKGAEPYGAAWRSSPALEEVPQRGWLVRLATATTSRQRRSYRSRRSGSWAATYPNLEELAAVRVRCRYCRALQALPEPAMV